MPEKSTGYEIPTEVRDFAEKSVEQARKAVDGSLGAAQKTAETFEGSAQNVQAGAQEMTRKTFTFAEQNISAAFDLAQNLVHAKDLNEAAKFQAEFVRMQFEAMQKQMKEFGATAQATFKQASKK